MLRDPALVSRRFVAGLAEDLARALRQAERPIARMETGPAALQIRSARTGSARP
jgi:hypothetical protein